MRIISHEQRRLSAENAWLEAEAGTTVLARDVVLEGKYSGVLHAHALSLVLPERLPAEALTQMGAHPGGLGQILLESRIETRREVLWYGREAADGLPPAIRTRMSGGCLSRTYRIITRGRPVSLIHERFPLEPDRIPAQV